MSVVSRWTDRLRVRRELRKAARSRFEYWRVRWRQSVLWRLSRAERARRWKLMEEAAEDVRRRERQVAEAERVLARHRKVTRVSDRGVALVASFEGFRSRPYRDAVGVWTIGYGETKGIGPDTPAWSRARAAQALETRLTRDYLRPVLELADKVGLDLAQNEADALASLVYNLGPGILAKGRSMGDAIRSKNRRRIADAFLEYDMAGGRRLAGLTRRRRAERALFLR